MDDFDETLTRDDVMEAIRILIDSIITYTTVIENCLNRGDMDLLKIAAISLQENMKNVQRSLPSE